MPIDPTGSNREALTFDVLTPAERDRRIEALVDAGVLVDDPRRWRPRWFDGRFLAASDLLAEQNYVLVRQADLGRAAGSGVVEGLEVRPGPAPGGGLRITPGYGLTDTGELVTVFEPLDVDPADVPEMRRLDAAFGLQLLPDEPGRSRTGLYVLALRAVEWTANPIGAYPTSLGGPRTVEDGTIVEGVAVTLIPYPDAGNESTWARRRARVAREVFVEGRDRGLRSGVLPLALVALRGNTVAWVDPFLVRRETGAERPAGMDFGFGARALREAHLLQYEAHLADALDGRPDRAFAAADVFEALPPVGRFPAAALDADRLTQRFFPAGVEVDLSFVPEDELPALIEEALLLPPLDLTLPPEALRGTGVVVLVPLPRADYAARRAALPDAAAPPALSPGFVLPRALRTPRELLLGRRPRPVPAPAPEEVPWRALLREAVRAPLLWYVRRRHLPVPSNVAATPVDATSPADADSARLADLVRADDRLADAFGRLRRAGLPEADLFTRRLAETRFVDNPTMLRSLLARATSAEGGAVRVEDVTAALAAAADPALGGGLTRLTGVDEDLGRRLGHQRVADSGLLAEVDRLARDTAEADLPELAERLREELGERGAPPADLSRRLTELRGRFGR